MSRSIEIYATRNDLLGLLPDVEAACPIHYAQAGMFEHSNLVEYGAAAEIEGLGELSVPEAGLGPIFLIADRDTPFTMAPVPQRRGGTRYAVGQKLNPDSVALIPGGQYDEQTVLAGQIGTCTESQKSVRLLRAIFSIIRKKWTPIRSYAVGPEAARVLDSGGRLAAGLKFPREYDLRR